ncbi:peptidase S41 [Ventosimonas gracilis]|uniref:Peptidase S41 n=1 Tax=Ventosimonas gracilis TaxID=1680762 RepID=A0A139SHQ2_9GAMM|nr:peptidase S41 [Ventosimonas gracilis]
MPWFARPPCALLAFLFFLPAVQSLAEQSQAPLPLEDLRTFVEVFERVKNTYVEPVSDQQLLENAIRGMLENLDPHSAYLVADDFAQLQESTSGEFGGLGIEVGMENGALKIIAPIDDSPAERAGIAAGDYIIRIDGQSAQGLSMMEAVNKMRGKPGEKIRLTLVRDGGQPFDVELTRALIKSKSVRSRLLESGYGYLRISQFQQGSGKETKNALVRLKKSNNNQPLQGLVLDLRNNPGGVLQAAVEVVDQFVASGLITYTKGRQTDSDMRFFASGKDNSEGVPLVVLINEGSASAAEIVAGALQDHHRAVLMGSTSFGKGSVQSIMPLSQGRALKLTTALYYTPNGRSIQAQGIVPDISVARGRLVREQEGIFNVKEADLAGHLDNQNPKAPTAEASGKAEDGDYQLSEALNLLKALNVLQGNQNKL